MMKKPYHHGDLRNKLIEAGIEILNTEGAEGFSLRQVAAKCDVSHAAPYSHFSNIDALKKAIAEHVENTFSDRLREITDKQENSRVAMTLLGEAYIMYFEEHPNYFNFLFHQSNIDINLDYVTNNQYKPFAFFRETAYKLFHEMDLPKEDHLNNMIFLWSLVHGISSLLTNKRINYSGNWKNILTDNIFLSLRGNDNENNNT